MLEINLAAVNGQLKAWQSINSKSNYGFEFRLRDMFDISHLAGLPVERDCIIRCFEGQLIKLVPSGTPDVVCDLQLDYSQIGWDEVEAHLEKWLFHFIIGQSGTKLTDTSTAFNASRTEFRKTTSIELANLIRTTTMATRLIAVANSSTYFEGIVILLESSERFFELRLGNHF